MSKALNEIGKLRNEMKVGFIELENQIEASNEKMVELIQFNTKSIVSAMDKMASNMEKGFLAVEEAMQEDVDRIDSEISNIKKRLDDANL